MLANVLPGLRELRAPLAAGYLWLLLGWMALGHKLPTSTEKKPDGLERLYQLEPVISSIGLAVVASVVAYVVGSIVIDVQTAVGRRFADLGRRIGRVLSRAFTKAEARETVEQLRALEAKGSKLTADQQTALERAEDVLGASMLKNVERWLVLTPASMLKHTAAVLVLVFVVSVAVLLLVLVLGGGVWWIAGSVAAILACLTIGTIRLKGRAPRRMDTPADPLPAEPLSLTDAGRNMLRRWESARAGEFRQQFADRREAIPRDIEDARERVQSMRDAMIKNLAPSGLPPHVYEDKGVDEARSGAAASRVMRAERENAKREALLDILRGALTFDVPRVDQATQEYLVSNRDLLKTRLIDLSEPLHSELDRPDAEATFRMALWLPLAALVIYLALEVSWWWWFAIVVPALLAWQWLTLRRQANSALVAAFVAREEQLGGEKQEARAEIAKGAILNFIAPLPARDEVRTDWTKVFQEERRRIGDSDFAEYILDYAMKRDEALSDGEGQRPSDEPEPAADEAHVDEAAGTPEPATRQDSNTTT